MIFTGLFRVSFLPCTSIKFGLNFRYVPSILFVFKFESTVLHEFGTYATIKIYNVKTFSHVEKTLQFYVSACTCTGMPKSENREPTSYSMYTIEVTMLYVP